MALTRRITLANLFLTIFWCAVSAGCSRPESQTAAEQSLAAVEVAEPRVDFKAMVERPAVAREIALAEQERPTDKRRTLPKLGSINVSYSERVGALALRLLSEVEPEFKDMTARALIEAIYIDDYGEPGGVAGSLYQLGNRAIMKELERRPRLELEQLKPASNSSIYTGPCGEELSVNQMLGELIEKK
jgi:hypothetical protein